MSSTHLFLVPQLLIVAVLYRLPDFPALVQEFIWETMDMAPEYPRLHKFLDYWDRNIAGERLSTRVASRDLVSDKELVLLSRAWRLN